MTCAVRRGSGGNTADFHCVVQLPDADKGNRAVAPKSPKLVRVISWSSADVAGSAGHPTLRQSGPPAGPL